MNPTEVSKIDGCEMPVNVQQNIEKLSLAVESYTRSADKEQAKQRLIAALGGAGSEAVLFYTQESGELNYNLMVEEWPAHALIMKAMFAADMTPEQTNQTFYDDPTSPSAALNHTNIPTDPALRAEMFLAFIDYVAHARTERDAQLEYYTSWMMMSLITPEELMLNDAWAGVNTASRLNPKLPATDGTFQSLINGYSPEVQSQLIQLSQGGNYDRLVEGLKTYNASKEVQNAALDVIGQREMQKSGVIKEKVRLMNVAAQFAQKFGARIEDIISFNGAEVDLNDPQTFINAAVTAQSSLDHAVTLCLNGEVMRPEMTSLELFQASNSLAEGYWIEEQEAEMRNHRITCFVESVLGQGNSSELTFYAAGARAKSRPFNTGITGANGPVNFTTAYTQHTPGRTAAYIAHEGGHARQSRDVTIAIEQQRLEEKHRYSVNPYLAEFIAVGVEDGMLRLIRQDSTVMADFGGSQADFNKKSDLARAVAKRTIFSQALVSAKLLNMMATKGHAILTDSEIDLLMNELMGYAEQHSLLRHTVNAHGGSVIIDVSDLNSVSGMIDSGILIGDGLSYGSAFALDELMAAKYGESWLQDEEGVKTLTAINVGTADYPGGKFADWLKTNFGLGEK